MKDESNDTLNKIAKHLAREIFKVGDYPKIKTDRIEFKGNYLGSEIGLGGLCESDLANAIKKSLASLIIKSLGK